MNRELHPSTKAILRYFRYGHLADSKLRDTSYKFYVLAHDLADELEGPELTAGLRHLLEAKDCVIRAALPEE